MITYYTVTIWFNFFFNSQFLKSSRLFSGCSISFIDSMSLVCLSFKTETVWQHFRPSLNTGNGRPTLSYMKIVSHLFVFLLVTWITLNPRDWSQRPGSTPEEGTNTEPPGASTTTALTLLGTCPSTSKSRRSQQAHCPHPPEMFPTGEWLTAITTADHSNHQDSLLQWAQHHITTD